MRKKEKMKKYILCVDRLKMEELLNLPQGSVICEVMWDKETDTIDVVIAGKAGIDKRAEYNKPERAHMMRHTFYLEEKKKNESG